MKTLFSTIVLCLLAFVPGCGSEQTQTAKAGEPAVVDAGCGQCLFSLTGEDGCSLAVRMEGKAYFVDGFTMGQFGDAHAADGMCQVVRKAKVSGDVVNGRFIGSTFEVLPLAQ